MGGICGWINWNPNGVSPKAVLGQMVRHLKPTNDRPEHQHASQNHALAAAGGLWDADFYSDDTLWVACYGDPTWTHDEWGRRATERGSAAAIAAGYQEHGPDFLRRLHGPLSLVVIDLAARSALLAIDRLGIHTLHYVHRGDLLIFATDATAVATHPAGEAGIDPQAIFDYLYFQVVPAPRSIYLGQKKLLPAQYVRHHKGQLELNYYWELAFDYNHASEQKELEAEFHALLRRSVGRVARDTKIGSFLSGGTDSSTVAGILSEIRGTPADTYSIGFDAPGYDEISYARIAAKHFRTRHHEYYVKPRDVVDAVPLIANNYDEPFGNSSAVPVYFCARLAQEDGIATLLAGDGGDELFAGNKRYAKQKLFELYGAIPKPLQALLVEPVFLHMPGRNRAAPFRKMESYIRQARIPLPDRLQTYNFLHRSPLQEIFSDDFLSAIDTEAPLRLVRETYSRSRSRASLDRMMHLDLKLTLADDDLKKVSGMCELAGVRVRYPLLDEDLVAFSARVPPKLKLKRFQLRYFFKHSLKDFLPPEILTKRKHGFGLPIGLWMTSSSSLQELVQDSLTSLRTRDILRPSYINQLSELHKSEHTIYYGVMLWALTMLEQWLSHHRK